MRGECRERFPRHQLQRKRLVSDPGMHHGTCATHVLWCMTGSLTHCDGENVPSIPGACATRNFPYLVRGPRINQCIPWILWDMIIYHMPRYSSIAHRATYSIPHHICTRLCCALFCCGCINSFNSFMWSYGTYSSRLLRLFLGQSLPKWQWRNPERFG